MIYIEIATSIDRNYPFVYAPTTMPTKLIFKNGMIKVGYFQHTKDFQKLAADNKYTFVEYGENAQAYRKTNDEKYVTLICGEDLKKVEYPSFR